MSDNLRRYRAIRDVLVQWYPTQPQGNLARHLHTMAALISGIVARKSTPLPHLATHVPDGTKVESRVTRLSRWGDNANIVEEAYCLPYETACCIIEACRRWCSSWMAASWAAGASP